MKGWIEVTAIGKDNAPYAKLSLRTSRIICVIDRENFTEIQFTENASINAAENYEIILSKIIEDQSET